MFESFEIISVTAIISYFIPLLLVAIRNLWNDRFFLLFAIYWAYGGIVNLTDIIPQIPEDIYIRIGVIYNMTDIPFILTILYYTTKSIFIRKYLSTAIALSFAVQIIGIVLNKGFNYDALKYSLGLGIVLVLIPVIWEIIRYLQKVEHTNKQNAKIFVYAAILFEYATFIVIYIFDYFIESKNPQDNFLIYYISSIIALLMASYGFIFFKKYQRVNLSYIPVKD